MFPEAYCIHRAAGRLRIKIPSEKGNKAYFAFVEEQLARCPLVTAAKSIPITGSVLLSYSGEVPKIAEFAEKNKLFLLISDKQNPGSVAQATITSYKALDAQIQKLSGGNLDLPHTAFVTLAGVGIYQIARGKIKAPAWHVALWYAFNIFLKAQRK